MAETYRHFKTRLLDNEILIVGFDYQGKPVNLLSFEALQEFSTIVDDLVANQHVRGAVLVSLKRSFIAGADVYEIYKLTDQDACKKFIMGVHDLFARIDESKKPWVTAIDGVCLGGGLELALACHWRVATEKAVLGLPEIRLGIIPGFGGTQRLPRLIGVAGALDLITTGRSLFAYPALKRGIIDDVVENQPGERTIETVDKEAVVAVAIEKAVVLSSGGRPKSQRMAMLQKTLGLPVVRDLVTFRKAREMIRASVGNRYPAPLKAVDAIQYGLPMEVHQACVEAEMPRLLELITSKLSKDLVEIFLATQKLKPSKMGSPSFDREKHPIGILGAGLMGSQIAADLSGKGFRVYLKDLEPRFLAAGMDRIAKLHKEDLTKHIINKAEFESRLLRVHPTPSWDGFKSSPFVIEAIKEVLPWKQIVLEEFEGVASADAIFATNTSSFMVSQIAEKAKHKERCVGMHFFNPLRKMRLVEIVKSDSTSQETLERAVELGVMIGKAPLVVRDCPGFLVNRILSRYLIEAVLLVAEGISITEVDTAAMDFGMAIDSGRTMGPLYLLDYVGIETALHVVESLKVLGERIQVHPLMETLVPEGERPITFWENGEENSRVSELAQQKYGQRGTPVSKENVTKRLIFPMRDEALRCLEERIVEEPWQIDLAMVYGVGFPAFRGGLLKEMAREGVDKTRAELERLTAEYGDRFQPCEYFKEAGNVLSAYRG